MTGPSFKDHPMTAPPVTAVPVANCQAYKECLFDGRFHQPKSLEVYTNKLCPLVESMIALSPVQIELVPCTLLQTLQVDPNL